MKSQAPIAYRLITTIFLSLLFSLVAAGCGGGSTGSDALTDEELLIAVTDEIAMACGDADPARINDLVGPGTQDRLRGQDNAFNPDTETVVVTDREITIVGDNASVIVTLEVTIDGDTSQADQTWEFVKVDGNWLLATIPDCSFG